MCVVGTLQNIFQKAILILTVVLYLFPMELEIYML